MVGCLAWYFLAALSLMVIGQDGDTSALVVILLAAAAVHLFWITREGWRPSSIKNERDRSPHLDVRSASTTSSRVPIPPDVRRSVFASDHYTCQYCGRGEGPYVQLEIDHIIPVSKGGTNDISNLVTACFECNRAKGAKLLDEEGMRRFELERMARGRQLDEEWERSQRRGCAALLPFVLVVAMLGVSVVLLP